MKKRIKGRGMEFEVDVLLLDSLSLTVDDSFLF
jgi:hypothetical protein